MKTTQLISLLGAAALASCVASCADPSDPSCADSSDPSCADPSDHPVLDAPTAGQALITGTIQPFRWHGGDPGSAVDILFAPGDGSPVVLAQGVPNTGKADVEIHLLGEEVRHGGQIRIEPSTSASSRKYGASRQALGSDSSDPAAFKVGSLAGFSWTGSVEEYYWLDVLTGEKQTVGTVGDLESWATNTLAVDHEAERIQIMGFHGTQQKLYVLDTKSGALVSDVAISGPLRAYMGLTIVGDHQLIAYSWNEDAQQEEMTRIDTATGATEVLGTVGDLRWWQSETGYAAPSNTAYVLGYTEADASALKLYSLDATTGELLDQKPLSVNGAPLDSAQGVVVNSADELLAFHWNGAAEEMLRLDPHTGQGTVIGTVGDLVSWSVSSPASINLTNDVVYVIGMNVSNESKLYALDGKSGALLYDAPIAGSPTDAVLIY